MKHSVRFVVGVFLLALLGGPTPGSVGSCSEDAVATDAQAFCLDTEALYCLRDFESDRISEEEYDACLTEVEGVCAIFSWNPQVCPIPPSEQKRAACISALRSRARLGTNNEDIVECQSTNLCGEP